MVADGVTRRSVADPAFVAAARLLRPPAAALDSAEVIALTESFCARVAGLVPKELRANAADIVLVLEAHVTKGGYRVRLTKAHYISPGWQRRALVVASSVVHDADYADFPLSDSGSGDGDGGGLDVGDDQPQTKEVNNQLRQLLASCEPNSRVALATGMGRSRRHRWPVALTPQPHTQTALRCTSTTRSVRAPACIPLASSVSATPSISGASAAAALAALLSSLFSRAGADHAERRVTRALTASPRSSPTEPFGLSVIDACERLLARVRASPKLQDRILRRRCDSRRMLRGIRPLPPRAGPYGRVRYAVTVWRSAFAMLERVKPLRGPIGGMLMENDELKRECRLNLGDLLTLCALLRPFHRAVLSLQDTAQPTVSRVWFHLTHLRASVESWRLEGELGGVQQRLLAAMDEDREALKVDDCLRLCTVLDPTMKVHSSAPFRALSS